VWTTVCRVTMTSCWRPWMWMRRAIRTRTWRRRCIKNSVRGHPCVCVWVWVWVWVCGCGMCVCVCVWHVWHVCVACVVCVFLWHVCV